MRVAKPFRLGVRTILVDDAGRVCLVRHTYRPGWYLPGGGVKRWETAAKAAVRETQEEAGVVDVRLGRLIQLYANFQVGYCDHVALYAIDHWRAGPVNSREIAEVGFFPTETLPDGTTGPTRRRMAEWRGDSPIAVDW